MNKEESKIFGYHKIFYYAYQNLSVNSKTAGELLIIATSVFVYTSITNYHSLISLSRLCIALKSVKMHFQGCTF